MKGKVFVVHCIDTEGPLYESPEVPFLQLKRIFGIEIEHTEENLLKLQRGEIALGGKEEAVKSLLDPHKITMRGSWEEIDAMLHNVMSNEFREVFKDSKGNGWVYSWFCMDHVGFFGNNPRRRDIGHHKVFDRYDKLTKQCSYGDIVQFHHHPVPFSGNCNESGTAFWGSNTLNEILTRKIIDRMWFPAVFRPGFHTERPDSHWFLEQWIPFDYGNQAVKGLDTNQPDLSGGRFGDWRNSVSEWRPYHPDHDNYQLEGRCRRWIGRCLNMHARLRELTEDDIEDAFKRADNGKNALLAFTDHDYKDMEYEVNKVRDMLRKVSEKYEHIRFEYVNALDGMRKCLDLPADTIGLECKIIKRENYNVLYVKAEKAIFGPQPYLALKTRDKCYYWDNFDFKAQNEWTYTFDSNTLEIGDIEKIGVAANNAYGYTEVVRMDMNTMQTEKRSCN